MAPDPVGLVAVTVPSCAYLAGLHRVWATAGRGRVVSVGRARTFAAGMAVETVVLCSPLATWADRTLTAHMVQHVVLLGVVGPLVGLGAPLPTVLHALPAPARAPALRWWRRVVASTRGDRWPRWLMGALVAHLVVLVGWHLPPLYDAAIAPGAGHAVIHGLEHLSYVATAAALWWVLAGSGRRARWGYGVLALFVSSLAGIALGAAVTLAPHPWYDAYRHLARPLVDQQTAGVVMWSFGGIATLAGALAVLVRWLDDGPSPASRPEGLDRPLDHRADHSRHAHRAAHHHR